MDCITDAKCISWLLFPIDCRISSDNISTWIHGPGASCMPTGSAEVGVTITALLLAAAFILFSLATTLFSFEVNPLSQVPGDCFTGRVEALWSAVRIFVAFTFVTQTYLTPLGSLILLALQTAATFAYHVHVLPFYLAFFNVLRAGIYASVLWASFASIIVASASHASDFTQWTLLALVPFAFAAGALYAHSHRIALMANLKRLRSEAAACESGVSTTRMRRASLEVMHRQAAAALASSRRSSAEAQAASGWPRRTALERGGRGAPADRRRRRDPFADFFETESRLSRAFESAGAAHAAIRSLLHEKDVRGDNRSSHLQWRALAMCRLPGPHFRP